MRRRSIPQRLSWTFLLIVASAALATCGIPTTPAVDAADEIQDAAMLTSELEQYSFSWSADYRLDPAALVTNVRVIGRGTVDATTGNVESIVTYDDTVRPQAEQLFPGDSIDRITAETRVLDDEVFVRGLNAGFAGDRTVAFDTWYRVTERVDDLTEPFVNNEVRPADVLPVLLEPFTDGVDSVEVDRDFILDIGTRFPGSLFDFGLRIGGGDFEISAQRSGNLISRVRIDGDDAEIGVESFVFEIEFEPLDTAVITAPSSSVKYP